MFLTVVICLSPAISTPKITVDACGLKVGEPLKGAWGDDRRRGWAVDPIERCLKPRRWLAKPGYSPFIHQPNLVLLSDGRDPARHYLWCGALGISRHRVSW